ncbi:Hydroxyproline-rich glycoprotein family protein [Quillaja saponaria]|uniref:Hydroxyproline-rich glycoprotein family protein n=1 Tax=Quillaja saponaria TaxID=32244 RepID=A0AAD7Q864_QUISA|nr:Hydroxyproline-rich glycoprotein family protein [Quillaja saponaria]
MGKDEDQEQSLFFSVVSQNSEQTVEANCGCRCARIRKLIGLKCIFFLLLSAAVFLSAIFWLPPFLHYSNETDLDPDSKYKDHDIVASFIVRKPVSLLEDNILQLADDIFEEIGARYTKVVILSLEPVPRVNMTKVVFGFDPDGIYSEMSSAAESLIRESFKYLVVNQLSLHLNESLFGDPFFFEVLKFKGGITIIPPQSVFLLQKVQVLFNFTLNNSIYEIQVRFNELANQLKSGLHLAPYENLYVSLSNSKGSTVDAPTITQSSVLLAIGNTPSMQRLKQLAQTITGSQSRNLGLNNTVFGRVKQVRLSSILQHSLHGGDGGPVLSPSPTPLPHPHHHNHHHHHHHHHYHHHHHHDHHRHHHGTNAHLAPAVSPAPMPLIEGGADPPEDGSPAVEKSAPAPGRSYQAQPPNCQYGRRNRTNGKAKLWPRLAPAVAPNNGPHNSAASPHRHVDPPGHASHSIPASSPFPNVVFALVEPPSKSETVTGHSDGRFLGPSPSSFLAFYCLLIWKCLLYIHHSFCRSLSNCNMGISPVPWSCITFIMKDRVVSLGQTN